MTDPRPLWSGPAARGEPLPNGDLAVHLTAPTGGCAFELADVLRAGDTADVRLVYRTPGSTFVTQVLTPLQVTVPAARLGEVKQVRLWLAQAEGERAPAGAWSFAAAFGR